VIRKIGSILRILILDLPSRDRPNRVLFVGVARLVGFLCFIIVWQNFLNLINGNPTPDEVASYSGVLYDAGASRYGRFVVIDGDEGFKYFEAFLPIRSTDGTPSIETLQGMLGVEVDVLYEVRFGTFFEQEVLLRRLQIKGTDLYDYWDFEGRFVTRTVLGRLGAISALLLFLIAVFIYITITKSRSDHGVTTVS